MQTKPECATCAMIRTHVSSGAGSPSDATSFDAGSVTVRSRTRSPCLTGATCRHNLNASYNAKYTLRALFLTASGVAARDSRWTSSAVEAARVLRPPETFRPRALAATRAGHQIATPPSLNRTAQHNTSMIKACA